MHNISITQLPLLCPPPQDLIFIKNALGTLQTSAMFQNGPEGWFGRPTKKANEGRRPAQAQDIVPC
jgi:hypothetical protein